MPIVVSTAYATVESVTNLMRVIANDMIYSTAGEILTDNANFMLATLNDSLEWFYNECNNHGIDTFKFETFLLSLTPANFLPANDPGQQVHLDDTGYFDGQSYSLTPQLPTDLLQPTRMWERQSNSSENWIPMADMADGLPSQTPGNRFGMFEFRQDGLYMPGATQTNDLRLRYVGTHPTITSVNDTLLFRGATGPMAYKSVALYLSSKNEEASDKANSEANLRMSQLFSRNSRMKQRQSVSRKSYGSRRGNLNFFPPRNA